jgi:hypothetical protein
VFASKNVALSPFGTVVALPVSNFADGVIGFGLLRNSEFISLILCFTLLIVNPQ